MSYHKKVNAVALLLRLRIEIIQIVVYFVGTTIGRPRFTGQILGGRPMAVPTIHFDPSPSGDTLITHYALRITH